MKEAENTSTSATSAKYDVDAVNNLIEAATGTARILHVMACDARKGDFAQYAAYSILFTRLWQAVKDVTRHDPAETSMNC